MSSTRILLWTVATLLTGFGCTRYEAPCTIGDPKELADLSDAYNASVRIRRLSADRVLMLQVKGSRGVQISDTSAEDSAVEAMIFDRHAVVSARRLNLPSFVLSNRYTDQLQDCAWLGDTLAVLSHQAEFKMDLQGVHHVSRQLTLSMYDEKGLRAGPIEIAACTDCILNAAIRSAGDEALMVVRQQTDPHEDAPTSWSTFGSDGTVHAAGILGELEADETIDMLWFAAAQREDAIFIPTTHNRVWLADSRFRRLTAPLTAQRYDEWDWDLARGRIAHAWTGSPFTTGDILTTQVGFDGQAQLVEDRITVGEYVVVMATAPESIGMVVMRNNQGWFMLRGSDGAKLGGDVPLGFRQLGAALVPTEASGFLLYSVERLETNEYVLRSRTVECHR